MKENTYTNLLEAALTSRRSSRDILGMLRLIRKMKLAKKVLDKSDADLLCWSILLLTLLQFNRQLFTCQIWLFLMSHDISTFLFLSLCLLFALLVLSLAFGNSGLQYTSRKPRYSQAGG